MRPLCARPVQCLLLLLLLILLCVFPGTAHGKKTPPNKLQVNVRHKPDHCDLKAQKLMKLTVHYRAYFFDDDDKEFDSTLKNDRPFKFVLGVGQVVKGWDEGLEGMCVGEKRRLIVPPWLAYGDRGLKPKIPGGVTLIYDVELIALEERAKVVIQEEL